MHTALGVVSHQCVNGCSAAVNLLLERLRAAEADAVAAERGLALEAVGRAYPARVAAVPGAAAQYALGARAAERIGGCACGVRRIPVVRPLPHVADDVL